MSTSLRTLGTLASLAAAPPRPHDLGHMTDRLRFDRFVLDRRERVLARDGAAVELNARYFDALALMVAEPGALISKDRFLGEVWRGVPVTDEALTQCIKTLRRALGDDAASPRFIVTVPKHGYRFVAPVEGDVLAARIDPVVSKGPDVAPLSVTDLTGAGMLGGGIAGLVGGLLYGFAAAPGGPGGISTVLVLACLTALVAIVGGAGVAGGIALAGRLGGGSWRYAMVGGAAGGLVIGAIVKLLGLDAFALLLGQSPGDFTGAAEGLALGLAVGLAGWIAHRLGDRVRQGAAITTVIGGLAGAIIVLSGGRLMAGSLDLMAHTVPHSRLSLAPIGALLGEPGLGPVSQVVTGALEGALFAAGVVSSMLLAERRRR